MYARRVAPGASLTKLGARAAPRPSRDPGERAPTHLSWQGALFFCGA